MLSRHMNEKFSSGTPVVDYDRYYAQDIIRDRRFFEENAGLLIQIMNKNFSDNLILSGLWCSQGAGHTMNIVAGKALVKFSIEIPHRTNAWAIPPDTENIDIMKIVEYAGGTNLSLAGIDTGGVNHNYAKLKFVETDGNTRAYAKKAGTYAYETYPDAVVTFGTTAPTAYEVVLAEFTSDGATLTFINNGVRQFMGKGREDVTIYTQADFAAIIDRTAANTYRFKQGITSVYLKALSTGYSIPLSGGDTWGALLTNYVTRLICEEGAFLDVGDTASYFSANTAGCVVDGLYVKGTGSSAAACTYSFLTFAENVTWRNCKTTDRYTNVDFAAFGGGSYASASYNTCKVSTIKCATAGATLRAFYQCYNMTNCYVSTFTPANGIVKVIDSCEEVNNLYITGVSTANALTVVNASNNICGLDITTVTGTTGQTVHIMDTCGQASSIIIQTVSGGIITGMYSCNNISDFNITGFTGASGVNLIGIASCSNMSAGIIQSFSNGIITGASSCSYLSNITCYSFAATAATSNECHAFDTCTNLVGCKAFTINSASTGSFGYRSCTQLSGCRADTITCTNGTSGIGFSLSNGLSACYATACRIDGFNTCIGVTSCYSVSNTGNGFGGCKAMGFNTSTGNGTAYATSYADHGTGNACADTAAGGYNG